VLIAGAAALAAPSVGPHGQVLDLASTGGPVDGARPGISSSVGSGTGAGDGNPVGSPEAGPSIARLGTEDGPPTDVLHGLVADGLAGEPTAPPVSSLEGYVWPIAHPRLTLPFGPTAWGTRLVDGQPFHDGIDLATFCGDRIVATHTGTVLAAGRRFDDYLGWVGDLDPYYQLLDAKGLWMSLPNVVVIDDGNGYRSVYAHFSRLVVKKGQHVEAGQLLGYEGATGHATGCHLHYDLFSPWERATFGIDPGVVKRMRVPPLEIARIDPFLVLPPRPGLNAPATPKPSPSAAPSAPPTPAEGAP
jgi:murein DD-endopeptidase MepM/ murein hydrolase activator NlpD